MINLDVYLHKNLKIKLTCTRLHIRANEEKDKEVHHVLARVRKRNNNSKVCGKSDSTQHWLRQWCYIHGQRPSCVEDERAVKVDCSVAENLK